MSLRIWLPLTKDLRQQGLDNVTVTNNGAVYSASGGKLGGCYSFGTGASALSLPASTFTSLTGDFSIACWVKIISWNTSYATVWAATSTSASYANIIAGMFRNSTSSKILFCIGNNSFSTQTSCMTTNDISLNVWNHFVCTYTAGKILLYQNGELVSSYNTSIVPAFSTTQCVNIGKMRESTYQSNCSVNDFRIYDHCLSPMEVKELAKGLVLHYPLNRQGWGQENLIRNTDFGGVSQKYTVTSATEGGFAYTPTETITANTEYIVSCRLRGNANMNLYKLCTGGNEALHWVNRSQLSTTEYRPFSIVFTYPSSKTLNQIYICTRYGTSNTSTGDWFEIEPYSLKLEKGSIATPWCPNSADVLATTMGLNGIIEYDCSGYCSNGTRTGIFSWTSDTPKYSASQYFNNPTGTSTLSDKIYISASPNLYLPSAITVGFWFKKEAITRGGLFTTGLATTTTITLAIHDYDSSVKVISSDNTTLSMGSYDTFIPSTNIWYYYTITFDGINAKIYINGDLKTTKSYSETKTLQNIIDITLGANSAGGVYRSAKGYYSDFRIYATALSADDVKSLYQNCAYIDSSGNVYGAVHSEV